MRKVYVGLSVSLVVSLLFLVACDSGSKIQTEDDICRAVFETIQNGDAETFNSYCITAEKMTALTKALEEDSPKDKSIKEELAGEDIAKMNGLTADFFKETQSESVANKLDLKTAVYEGVVDSEVRVKTSTFKAVRTEFKISFDAQLFYVRLDVIQAPESISVYDAKLLVFDKVEMSLVEPKDNPLVISEGEEVAIQVKFDAATANKYGAWIQTLFDGKVAGMKAGTTLESPYMDTIPRKPLTVGKHTVTYQVHPGGQQSLYQSGQRTHRPLGEAYAQSQHPDSR